MNPLQTRTAVRSNRSLAPLAVVLIALLVTGCSKPPAPSVPAAGAQVASLESQDLVVGSGAVAANGSKITVHYTGWLYDPARPDHKGTQFDSSRTGGEPFQFVLGTGQVIPGWDQGVQGMKVGGQRQLVIPAALAYGDSGAGGVIPPGATLVFDVELVDVEVSSI
jgi:FKBP-type peptidyl-prolyl cis-trans isomerase FkpA